MSEGEQSREIIAYIRERDEVKEQLKKVEEELRATKSKLYDAKSKIQDLEEKIKQQESSKGSKPSSATNKPVANGKLTPTKTPSKKAPPKSPSPQPKAANQKASLAPPALKPTPQTVVTAAGGVRHPPITGKEDLSSDAVLYYEAIGRALPDVKLLTVLEAEKKFNLADTNKDGVIDKDELDQVLAENVTIFTPNQLDEIIKEIDQDNNGTLEFIEVLTILDKMAKRRSKLSTLPANIQDQHTKVCVIQ